MSESVLKMKLNKKGFMMAEVIVVSSIVLITLTSLYMSYNKITNTNLSQENTTFNEYLEYLKNSITVDNCNYILVMEKCDKDNKDCKYGYLESEECIK